MTRLATRLAVTTLGVTGLALSGCALPMAVWPEWPTGLGHTLRVEAAEGGPADKGYVLLRIYEYDGSGVAEGDRTVRNQQVLDAAFDYRRAIAVRVAPETAVRYRLVDLRAVPISPAGLAELPGLAHSGSLWLVLGKEKARPGLHRRLHFAEVQAMVPGRPPSGRAEVRPDLRVLRVAAGGDAVAWRQELEYARDDVEAASENAFVMRYMLHEELQRLAARHPAAFVPDGVSASPPTRNRNQR